MLDVTSLSLHVSTHANLFKLARHLIRGLSEDGQLISEVRYVLFGCHICQILRGWEYLGHATGSWRKNQDDAGTDAEGGAAAPFGNEAKAQNVPIKAAHRVRLSRFVIDGGF